MAEARPGFKKYIGDIGISNHFWELVFSILQLYLSTVSGTILASLSPSEI